MLGPTKVGNLPMGYKGAYEGDVINFNMASALIMATDQYDVTQGEEKPFPCHACKEPVMLTENHRTVFGITYCDKCVKEYIYKERMKEIGDYWKRACPADYRDTDQKSPEFNRDSWEEVKKHPLETSFVFLGETGKCKTRIACELIKRAMLKGYTAKIVFPDDVEDMHPQQRREFVQDVARPKFMLLDDFLSVAGASDQNQKFVFNVINKRVREKRTTIITSQIDYGEFLAEADKFRNMSKVESERILAIIRRLKEKFTPIDFDMNKTPADELATSPW